LGNFLGLVFWTPQGLWKRPFPPLCFWPVAAFRALDEPPEPASSVASLPATRSPRKNPPNFRHFLSKAIYRRLRQARSTAESQFPNARLRSFGGFSAFSSAEMPDCELVCRFSLGEPVFL
jgi:hypothetical protein